MASSASGQDEPNRALWLATRAGKMEPSCPLGTTRYIPQAKFPQKPYNKTFIQYWPSLFGQDDWILASFFFCEFMDLDFVSVHKHAKKKNLANIQPSWPHTCMVNNPYISPHMHNKVLWKSINVLIAKYHLNFVCDFISTGSGFRLLSTQMKLEIQGC